MKKLFVIGFLFFITFTLSIQVYAGAVSKVISMERPSQSWSTSTYMGAALNRSHEIKKSGDNRRG